MVAGTVLFVLGFSVVFALLGLAAGAISELLRSHSAVITQVLGGVTIVLGLLFFGAFDRFVFAGRIIKLSVMPKAGLAGASSIHCLCQRRQQQQLISGLCDLSHAGFPTRTPSSAARPGRRSW